MYLLDSKGRFYGLNIFKTTIICNGVTTIIKFTNKILIIPLQLLNSGIILFLKWPAH